MPETSRQRRHAFCMANPWAVQVRLDGKRQSFVQSANRDYAEHAYWATATDPGMTVQLLHYQEGSWRSVHKRFKSPRKKAS